MGLCVTVITYNSTGEIYKTKEYFQLSVATQQSFSCPPLPTLNPPPQALQWKCVSE